MKTTDQSVIELKARAAKLTPPGYSIKLTVAQGIEISKLLSTPGWKILEDVFVPQRKDHIARQALNSSQDTEQLAYYKGEVAELQLFFLTMKHLKKTALKQENEESNKIEA